MLCYLVIFPEINKEFHYTRGVTGTNCSKCLKNQFWHSIYWLKTIKVETITVNIHKIWKVTWKRISSRLNNVIEPRKSTIRRTSRNHAIYKMFEQTNKKKKNIGISRKECFFRQKKNYVVFIFFEKDIHLQSSILLAATVKNICNVLFWKRFYSFIESNKNIRK